MTPEYQIILDTLLADGWKRGNSPRTSRIMLYKAFGGYARCRCNDDKDKQVEVYWHAAYGFPNGNEIPEAWSVHNDGELPDGQWLRMRIEGLGDRAQIERAVWQLLQGWDHVVKISDPTPGKHL